MTRLFGVFFDMGTEACMIIVALFIVRALMRRAPRKYSYMLWLVVLFRLLCPISFQSAFSLFSFTGSPVRMLQDGFGAAPVILGETFVGNKLLSEIGTERADTFLLAWEDMFAMVWLLGIAVLAGYYVVRVVYLRWQLQAAGSRRISYDGGEPAGILPVWLSHTEVWESDGLETAFVMGVIRPRIYLPAGLEPQVQRYILAHECMHLRRGDPLWRVLGVTALCMHWYHPFVWAAWAACIRDMEMSCDEAVVRSLGPCAKKGYSAALLAIASGQHGLPGRILAFGEGEVKSRIRNVLNYKKPAFLLTAITTVGIVGLGLFLAADPSDLTNTDAAGHKTREASVRSEEKQFAVYGVWEADLTHDGKPETIRFDIKSLQQAGVAEITVSDSNGKLLFSKALSTSHAGWDTFALCHAGDGAYLLEYNPYFAQGMGAYSYQLFSLSDSGKVLVKEEDNVEFSAGMPYTAPDNDVEKLVSFTDTVNDYWEKSVLLVTTDQSVLSDLYDEDGSKIVVQADENYYAEQNALARPLHYVERMGWTDIVLEGKKSADTTKLRARLKAVNRVLAEHRKISGGY